MMERGRTKETVAFWVRAALEWSEDYRRFPTVPERVAFQEGAWRGLQQATKERFRPPPM